MTHHSEQASANASTAHPTTKSHCPAGAGIINQPAAAEGSHTPPQACATPAINLACQPPSEAPHAQLAEGYKHSTLVPVARVRKHSLFNIQVIETMASLEDGETLYRATESTHTPSQELASSCARANEYCQQHGIGKWGESAVQALINDHKRLTFQLAHAHRQEQRLDDRITELLGGQQ